MKTAACVLVLGMVVLWTAGPGRADGIDVTKLQGVYLAPAGSQVLARARNELIGGLRKLYGAKVPAARELPEGPAILLGKQAALAAGLITQKELDAVRPGGFVIRTRGNRLAIAGVHGPATVYGVRQLLERLGMRYFEARRPAVVARKPASAALPELNWASKPAIVYRNFYSRTLEWGQCNTVEKVGREGLWIDHSAGYLIPKDLYYDEHPEYFAMGKDGKRVPKDHFTYHRTPLCLSNPDVTRISIERLNKWIEAQPEKVFYPITYGDTGLWCHCDKCQAMDPAPGQYATRLLTWVNAVAGAVGKKHPDKHFITFAYGGSDTAPPKLRPAENVWICGSVNLAGLTLWDHDVARGGARKAMEKMGPWLKIAPGRVTTCEYQGRYYPSLPDTLAGKYRFYQEQGLTGLIFSFGRPQNFVGLWEYLYPRLMWDPSRDAQALTAEYVRYHFGPAAEAMQAYFDLAHERYHHTLENLDDLGDGYYAAFYADGYAEKAMECFFRARAAAKGNAGLQRDIEDEAQMFLMDWMKHPRGKKMDAAAKETLGKQLDYLARFAGKSDAQKIALARSVHKIGLTAESTRKGTLSVVEAWLKKQNFPRPQVVEQLKGGGVRIPAEGFMYAGWGPRGYHGGHALPPCPERVAVAVYVKGNSQNRSSRTEAEFLLKTLPGDGAATLEIWGQDCDHPVAPAEIRIAINGRDIFEGQVSAVKGNWSGQTFQVPAGVLKTGTNKLEVFNVGDPASLSDKRTSWAERWFMISEAKITFGK